MARGREELTAGEWAVLALVNEQPTHGFALARAMAPDGDVGRSGGFAGRSSTARW
jgi:hypothetical protein